MVLLVHIFQVVDGILVRISGQNPTVEANLLCCVAKVSSEHPELDASVPEVLNDLRDIFLEIVFNTCARNHCQFFLSRGSDGAWASLQIDGLKLFLRHWSHCKD